MMVCCRQGYGWIESLRGEVPTDFDLTFILLFVMCGGSEMSVCGLLFRRASSSALLLDGGACCCYYYYNSTRFALVVSRMLFFFNCVVVDDSLALFQGCFF